MSLKTNCAPFAKQGFSLRLRVELTYINARVGGLGDTPIFARSGLCPSRT